MKYSVKYVSKGTVYITDGVNNYRADGEGLLNYDKRGADYVLYKDSIRNESLNKADSKLTETIKSNILHAIISHFNKNKMQIDIV